MLSRKKGGTLNYIHSVSNYIKRDICIAIHMVSTERLHRNMTLDSVEASEIDLASDSLGGSKFHVYLLLPLTGLLKTR